MAVSGQDMYEDGNVSETPLPVFPSDVVDVESGQTLDKTGEILEKLMANGKSSQTKPNPQTTPNRPGSGSMLRLQVPSPSPSLKINVQPVDGACDESPGAEQERRVVLNVGGTIHETCLSTLLKFPKTRLYELAKSIKEDREQEGNVHKPEEVFFDRDPYLFSFIINFYRAGQLHVPLGVCGPMFKKELDFWKLDDREIEPCCFVTYVSYEETNEALAQFDYSVKDKGTDDGDTQYSDNPNWWQRVRPKLWRALQSPYSSTPAMIYAFISVLVVLVSITVFVVETLPYFGHHTLHSRKNAGPVWTSADLRKDLEIFTDINDYDILIIIDNCCNIFFFIEYVVKLLATPSKLKYIRSPISVTELLCIVPYYLAMVIVFWHPDPILLFDFLRVLYAMRVLRIFRIFVLMKHFMALKILVYTIKASTKELLLLVLILLIGVIIFACMEYYAELLSEDENNTSLFPHIPIAFWWALVTMTTVGYGDVFPKTLFGYTVGACCAISGVLVVALTVPIIVNNFSVYYTHAQSREKLKLRKKQLEDSKKAKGQWKRAAGVSWSWGILRSRSPTTTVNKGNRSELTKVSPGNTSLSTGNQTNCWTSNA